MLVIRPSCLRFAWIAALIGLLAANVEAGDPSPILQEDTVAVVKVDLTRFDAASFSRRLFGPSSDSPYMIRSSKTADELVAALKKARAAELFLMFDFADLPGQPIIAVPIVDGADPDAIIKVLGGGPSVRKIDRGSEVIRGMIVVGRPESLARIRSASPAARPDLIAALAEGGPDALIRVAVSPGVGLRRAVEESLPTLPADFGGGPIIALTRGASWLALVLPNEANSKLRVTLQAKDSDSAQTLAKLIKTASELAAKVLAADPTTSDLVPALIQIGTEPKGDRIVAEVDPEKAVALISIPIRRAGVEAQHTQSVNNLKQLALAMHNYHATNDTFPPAYRVDRNHKPLLSWRVLILPFLEELELYNQFHLDEPWDSPNNKPLIARMPKIYAAPSEPRALIAEGKTIYLAPRGKQTILSDETGTKIKTITDGISNTIMFLQADDADAVVWTKPDDLEIDRKPLLPNRRIIAAFGDGSVKTLSKTIKPEMLLKLLTKDGGEVLSADDF